MRVAVFVQSVVWVCWLIAPIASAQTDAERFLRLPSLKIVTDERVENLDSSEREAWKGYLVRSNELAVADRQQLWDEIQKIGATKSQPAPSARAEFEYSHVKPEDPWWKSDEAQQISRVVLSYQTPAGGWCKGIDYGQGVRPAGTHWTSQSGAGWHYCGTLDNRSTTEQIHFLAAHHHATGDTASREGAVRGFEWIIAAQFPSGGWPQVYPLEPGYHEAITLNDDAMTHALELLLAASSGEAPYNVLPQELQSRAAVAFQRGIDCLLRCQIVLNGKKTLWCAQHDPIDLSPLGARLKEPPSLSGAESSQLLKFLMREAPPSPATTESIEAALAWLETHSIHGLRKAKNAAGKTDYVDDPTSEEIYWARFYDLETSLPIFAGADDGVIYSSFSEMAQRNRVGYDYFTTRPRDLNGKEKERWRKRLAKLGVDAR